MITFKTEQDYVGYYKGLSIVESNQQYGVVKLNGDSAIYLEITYNQGSESYVDISFSIGDYEKNNMYDLKLTDRVYDSDNNVFIDKLADFKLQLTESTKGIYLIPIPITNKNLKINIDSDEDDIDLEITVKSQSYRV